MSVCLQFLHHLSDRPAGPLLVLDKEAHAQRPTPPPRGCELEVHRWASMFYYPLCLLKRLLIKLYLSALNLIGPRAMDVLAELSYVSMTPEHFPSMFCKVRETSRSEADDERLVVWSLLLPSCCPCLYLQEMSVGYANGIRVMSMTHTGEPGFMLYIPIEVQMSWIKTTGQGVWENALNFLITFDLYYFEFNNFD